MGLGQLPDRCYTCKIGKCALVCMQVSRFGCACGAWRGTARRGSRAGEAQHARLHARRGCMDAVVGSAGCMWGREWGSETGEVWWGLDAGGVGG